jgi:hypothetical protein
MRCPLASLVAVALSGAALGCSASTPPMPAGAPPTPKTVTVENPGGDAFDPELAALERLAEEPWVLRRDRENTLLIPLADARHWQRVRLWGYPTRVAFRFGDDHYGVLAIWYRPAAAGRGDPESCLTDFLAEARPLAEGYGTRVVASHLVHSTQLGSPLGRRGAGIGRRADGGLAPKPQGVARSSGPMVVEVIDAEVDAVFTTKEYAGALASYPSWPGTCLLQGFVVVAGKHKELAERIRDRWVTEGATHLAWHPRLSDTPAQDQR